MKGVNMADRYVGYDGKSYFCKRCGRAGFASIAAVRGHLGLCKARAKTYDLGAFAVPVGGLQQHPIEGGAGAAAGAAAPRLNDDALVEQIADRVVEKMRPMLMNEVPHTIATRDTWWPYIAIIVSGFALYALLSRDVEHTRLREGFSTVKQGLTLASAMKGLFT
jgi:hypothetical protein